MVSDTGDHALLPGTLVALRGERWTVASETPHADCRTLRLERCGPPEAPARTFLLPFDRPRLLDTRARLAVDRRGPFFSGLRDLVLRSHPLGGCGTAVDARIALMPFQLEPALAMLRHGHLRVLIADEVGLGKTVQAGIILTELLARDDDLRALVVCPAGLREQWQSELAARFSLRSTLADAAWLVGAGRDLPPDVNPWSLPGVYVSSLDFAKQPEVQRALEDVRWDLLVVDEVHNASPGTARLAAAQSLGARSRRVLLLTATPPDGEAAHFDAMAAIGRTDAREPLAMFRRTRADAALAAARKTILQPVRLTAAERRMHRLLERYTTRLWQEASAREDARGRLVAILLRKRALSGATPLAATLRRRIACLGREAESSADVPRAVLLPFDEDPVEDAVPEAIVSAPGLADVRQEAELLDELASAAERASRAESKLAFVRRLLGRAGEPLIVFTEYRDTLTHLATALASYSPILLHGGMSTAERVAAQRGFDRSGKVLLATDAASEGLNLHHRCRAVVHYELPWMPMRLEQRTGRVDRFGQSRRVHEVLLVARHTCERLVLAPLVQRIRAAGARSRFAAISESAVAAAVLQGDALRASDAEMHPLIVDLSLADEAREETHRLGTLRRLASARCRPRGVSPGLLVHADRGGSDMLFIVRLAVERADGRTLHEELVPVCCQTRRGGLLRTPQDVRRFASEILSVLESSVLDAVFSARSNELATARRRAAALLDGVAKRELEVVRGEDERVFLQAGLFDRRAEAAAEARGRRIAVLLEESRARVEVHATQGLRTHSSVVALYIGWPPS